MKFIPHPRPHSSQPDRKVWLRRFFALLTFGVLSVSLLSSAGLLQVEAGAAKRPEQGLGTSVVISEFRTRGPNGENDEFIELFNPTQVTVDISGWKIWVSDNAGLTNVLYVFPASTLIQPGQHRLIINSSGYMGSVLADSDISSNSYTLDITDYGGIAISLPNDTIINQVGMGPGSTYKEGSVIPPPPLENTDQSYSRIYLYGCQDNNNNSTDFVLINPSTPQNSSSIFTVCPPLWERLILINEVAWGGTQADDTLAQWIELYNPSLTETITLNGWYLQIPGKGNIPLSGSIGPLGYYLIERNQADTNVAASLVYAFPFLNVSGDSLYLYSDTNNLVDSANSNGGPWPAGNRFVNYNSMERRSNEPDTDPAWLTFDPMTYSLPFAIDRLGNNINGSPGQPNSPGLVSTPTFTPTLTFTPTSTFTPTPTLTPSVTSTPSTLRSVLINEVAWMGTLAASGGADDEWIELYNPGSAEIDISGWKITLDDAAFITIESGKTIGGGQYFLLERGSDATSANENQIFTGAISNDGKKMKLLAASTVIDSANLNGGAWPAGNNTNKCSMERRGSSPVDSDTAWITNTGTPKVAQDKDGNWICGTPGYRNWAYDVTPTPSPVSSAVPTPKPTKTRTPTRIPAVSVSQIIINEFLPHSRSDWNNDGEIDSGDEFIELMNVGNASGSLEGWRLDDQEGDSSPYTLSGVTLAPGARVVFFASETGLLLSNRSDSVRILKANGAISDAFTYTTVPIPDQTWCRLPDGKPTWIFGCQPTLSQINQTAETIYRGEVDMPAICESPDLPVSIYLAECMPSGLESWSRRLWDDLQPVFRVLVERHGQEYWIE